MKAIVFTGVKNVEFQQREKPIAPEGWALIRVSHAGICGSDLTIFLGAHPRAKAPLIMGHEFSGYLEQDIPDMPKGTLVTVDPLLSCGHCTPCREGNSHVCQTADARPARHRLRRRHGRIRHRPHPHDRQGP